MTAGVLSVRVTTGYTAFRPCPEAHPDYGDLQNKRQNCCITTFLSYNELTNQTERGDEFQRIQTMAERPGG